MTPLVLAAITLASWALRPAPRRDPAPLSAFLRRDIHARPVPGAAS